MPITHQGQLLRVARSTLCYQPQPVSPQELRLMRRLDERTWNTPFWGARKLAPLLNEAGFAVDRRHVTTLKFAAEDFTDVLKAHALAISMGGKGRWVDNVFVERLWRSVKYEEEVYLRAYESPREVTHFSRPPKKPI